MGVDIFCKDKHFYCGYGTWNDFRTSVIYSTVDYIQENNFDKINPHDEDGCTYRDELKKFVEYWHQDKSHDLESFLGYIRNRLIIMDAFIYLYVGGVYTLSFKNDFDSIYSVGNSRDICDLFGIIRPFFEKRYPGSMDVFDQVECLFQESVDHHENVTVW